MAGLEVAVDEEARIEAITEILFDPIRFRCRPRAQRLRILAMFSKGYAKSNLARDYRAYRHFKAAKMEYMAAKFFDPSEGFAGNHQCLYELLF